MKKSLQLVILLFACNGLEQSCTTRDEKIVVLIETHFDVLDREANPLSIQLNGNYNITARTIQKLEQQDKSDHKNVIALPIIRSITRKIMEGYTPGEIYSFKRKEIEDKIVSQCTTDLAAYGIELTRLFIGEVKLPDTVRKRLEQELQEKAKAEKEKQN